MRLRFVLGEVLHGLRRNATMALSVILVTFVSLTFVGSAALIQKQVDQLKTDWYGKVEVSIFLCPDKSTNEDCAGGLATPEQEAAIYDVLNTGAVGELVDDVDYESREEMLAKVIANDDRGIFASLTADQMQASFRVKLKDPEQFTLVSDAASKLPGVDVVYDQREIISTLFELLNAATIVAAALAGVMLLAAILLITTTIRLSAMSRRKETAIMRMVGSSRTFIQLPFMLEGAIAATLGALLAIAALWFGVKYGVEDWLSGTVKWVNYVDAGDVLAVAPWLLLIAIALAAFASLVTLGKYTRA